MKSSFNIFTLLLGCLTMYQAGAQKINITEGSKLVLNNNVSLVLLNGAVINNGAVVPGNSSLYFRGNDSSFLQGSSAITLNNLYIDPSASKPLTITTPVSVAAVLNIVNSNGKINTNNLLTLRSTSAKTARLAVVPNGATINGKVTVERYIQAHRAWRLLTVPLQNTEAPTIKASWQENAASTAENPAPGFGTHITGATAPADGFDLNASRSASCKEYIAGSWLGVANTDVQKITDQPGYMLFVRGSRANQLAQGSAATADNTILSASGNLHIGDVNFAVNSSGYTLIGNPYASPIDFATLTRSVHVPNTFYVWDPLITANKGLGGYVTVSYNGDAYDVTSSISTVNQYIQSGTAFFVTTDGNSGTITVKESDKCDQTRVNVLRPSGVQSSLRTDLLLVNTDGSTALFDGIFSGFSNDYSNGIDEYDAAKLNNGAENISLLRDGKNLSIERRQHPAINASDTIFFRLSTMSIKKYQLHFAANQLNYPNTIGLLMDQFTGNQTVINLNGITDVPFSVSADARSYASDRFMLVLKNTGVLATGFTLFAAKEANNNIILNWQTGNDLNAAKFQVQRSVDGNTFNNIAEALTSVFFTAGSYSFTDAETVSGLSYYRIAALSNSGEVQYSKIISIEKDKAIKGISVYPTIVTGNSISLQLNQQSKGTYSIKLSNATGQILLTKKIEHPGGSKLSSLQVNQDWQNGIYFLEITAPGNNKTSIKLIKQ